LLFNKRLDGTSVPPTVDFTFTAGVDEIGINAIYINYDTLFIALDSLLTVYDDSTLLLSYTSGPTPLKSYSSPVEVANFADSTVVNNLNPVSFLLTDGKTEGWYAAHVDYVTYSDGDSINKWSDRSGNNRHFLASSDAYEPWFKGDSIVFNGTTNRMQADDYVEPDSLTIYMVYKPISFVDQAAYFQQSSTLRIDNNNGDNNNNRVLVGGVSIRYDITYNNWYILSVTVKNNDTCTYILNGGSKVSTAIGAVAFLDYIRIGYSGSVNAYANFAIKEFIYRSQADDDETRAIIMSYLNNKYAIYEE
jgi:hypothetical protein